MKQRFLAWASCFSLTAASPKGGAYRRVTACALSGVLGGLVFTCNAALWPLSFVFLIPFELAFFSHADRWRSCFGYAFAYSVSYYLVLLSWFGEMKELIFSSLSPALADVTVLAALFSVSLVEGALTALLLSLFAFLRRGKWWDLFAFSALFVLSETVMEYMGDITFPWGRLSQLVTPCTPFLQSASLFGSLFLSLLLLLISGGVAMAILHHKMPSARRAAAILAAGLLCANFAFGFLRQGVLAREREDGTEFGVLLVQGNFGTWDKWSGSGTMLQTHLDLTRKGLAAHPDTKLVVWPESAVVENLTVAEDTRETLKEFAAERGITLVAGAFSSSDDPQRDYNSAWVFTPSGISDALYSKQVLVPMGEVVPFRPLMERLLPWLFTGEIIMPENKPGEGAAVADTPCGKLGTLVCYESIVPHIVRENTREGADVLVMITNDSWFGDSAALREHLSHAQMRAVENGCDLLRAANTGISALIRSDGTVAQQSGIGERGTLYVTARRASSRTLYSRTGDLIAPLAAGYLLLLGLLFLLQKRKM